MKPTAFLINCARGGIVDESALVKALQTGKIAGAAVDVLSIEPPKDSNPLLEVKLPNLIITPHIAWASKEARQRIIDQTVENIRAFKAGRPIRTV
jgi:glycerate dehydrogenase